MVENAQKRRPGDPGDRAREAPRAQSHVNLGQAPDGGAHAGGSRARSCSSSHQVKATRDGSECKAYLRVPFVANSRCYGLIEKSF